MSTWYFLRHAETAANVGRVYNPDHDELTATGKAQASAASAYVRALAVQTVFCSPLSRAQETARLLGVQPVLVADLTDRQFGAFAGKPFGSIREYCKTQQLDAETFVPAGGESSQHVHERTAAFLEDLPGGDFLFITHAGIIADVVRSYTKREWSMIHIENCALWVFTDGMLTHENWRPWETDK